MVRVKDCEEVRGVALESVTLTMNEEVPTVVGVPAISPVEGANAIPAGRVPEGMLHLYGCTPPCAVKVLAYSSLTIPRASA